MRNNTFRIKNLKLQKERRKQFKNTTRLKVFKRVNKLSNKKELKVFEKNLEVL